MRYAVIGDLFYCCCTTISKSYFGLYIFFAASFNFKWDESYRTVLGAIYSSFITMSTFGDFNLNPKDFFGASILLFQSLCGLFMTLLCLARFIALLPTPSTLDESEAGPKREAS